MTQKPNNSTPLKAIAIAEGSSSVVSMGALWAMGHRPAMLQPLNRYLADTVIFPQLEKQKHPQGDEARAQLYQQALDKASLLTKGAVMIGAGFAAHLPIQLALEGRFHPSELKRAAFGKGVGLAVSLGSIVLLNRVAPELLPAVQNAIFPLVKPFLPKDEKGRDSRQAEEIAKLLIVDVPSSVMAGLINYHWSKGR